MTDAGPTLRYPCSISPQAIFFHNARTGKTIAIQSRGVILVNCHAALIALLLSGTVLAATQSIPPLLLAALVKAKIETPIVAWCRGEFGLGNSDTFATAHSSVKGGGRYLVINSTGETFELASFTGSAYLSCYTASEATNLGQAIADAEIIHGNIVPMFSTTVICAFVEETNAICWQYSPSQKEFVKVGERLT